MPWIRKFWQTNGNWIEKVSGAVLTERAITIAGRALIDVPMVWLFANGFGVVEVFLLATPAYFLFSLIVVVLYEFFLSRGRDLLGIDYLRKLEAEEGRLGFFDKMARWVMRRKITIFLLGSLFFLDPDVVTLLLRKKGESLRRVALRITLPSAIWAIIFWSVTYKLAVMGFRYAQWLIG
jgi:hypothetical protein